MKKIIKMDELEMSISLQAIKFSWGTTAFLLNVWMVYEMINSGIYRLSVYPQFYIFVIQIFSYLIVSMISGKKFRDEK